MRSSTGYRHRTTTRGRVAAEAAGTFYAAGESDELAGFEARDEAPTPPLAEALELTAAADRVMARLVTIVQRLHRTGEVEASTGLPVEAWLARHGRLARADRRMVQTAADVLTEMPNTQQAFNDGRISWGQIRSIVLACRTLDAFDRTVVDEGVAEVVDQAMSWEPDELTWRVDRLVAELDHRREERAEQRAVEGSFVAMQPRLDGSGGTIYGDLDGLGYGIVDNALDVRMGLPDGLERSDDDQARSRNAKTIGRARADALVGLCADSLAGTPPADSDEADEPEPDAPGDPDTDEAEQPEPDATGGPDQWESRRSHRRRLRGRGADEPGHHPAAGHRSDDASPTASGPIGPDHDPAVAPVSPADPKPPEPSKLAKAARPAQPLILATLTLEDLLGLSHGPARILTTLTGGRLNLTSKALRRLIADGGAAIRTIVLDDNGRAVGVGRRSRFAPGWLKEASLAFHDTCLVPGCPAAARICDADHATGVDANDAPTDLDEIGPWCRRHHTDKTNGVWEVTPLPNGGKRVTHRRSGLSTVVPPATLRLANPKRRRNPRRRRP